MRKEIFVQHDFLTLLSNFHEYDVEENMDINYTLKICKIKPRKIIVDFSMSKMRGWPSNVENG